MRAAAILGLGSSAKSLKPFQENSSVSWVTGMPASTGEVDAVLIFGGDGTVHRHLGQLVKLQVPVLVVPCGSGNDFARALKLRSISDALAAWRRFLAGGDVRAIDLGLIADVSSAESKSKAAGGAPALHGHCPHEHYFCCVAGVGLDGEVARLASLLPRWLRRRGGYVLSLIPALFRFAPVSMKISLPSGDQRIAKATVLAAFANTPTYGGGMNIAPRARFDDGLLDVCVVSDIAKAKLLGLFPTVYFGRHLNMTDVEYFQAEHLRVETERPMDVYADGEYVCQTPIKVSVAPGVLRVIV